MKSPQEVAAIIRRLKELYPDAACSLDYGKDYELLFSVRLAAQCTDARVNQVTPALFARFPTLEAFAAASPEEVGEYVRSCGFWRAKARDIVASAQQLLARFGGKVPDNMDDLLTLPGVKMEDITEIYSHEQAIGQCSKFLNSLNGVRVIPCDNTAVAAKMVSERGDRHAAAISSHACAELYGLESIRDDIQDSDNNYTRFICIAKDPVIYAGANRISLVIACDNKPGALYEILSKLAALGINMTKLESCPVTGRNFEFIFFLELEASVLEPGVLPMLEELERSCQNFQFLGNYAEV
mgnify:CR=1 FL=1